MSNCNGYSSCTAGSKRLPITYGSLLDFPRDPAACMRRLHREHGNIAALEEQGQRIIVGFGPEYNQIILSDPKTYHSQFFAIRGSKNSAQRRLTSGILSMNGDEHKRNRRIIMEPFHRKSIEHYGQSLVQLTEDTIKDWQPGHVRDIFKDMTQHMLRVTASILFGYDQPKLAFEIGRLTERWVAMNHELGMGAFLPDPSFASNYDQLLKVSEELEAQIRAMIEYRRSASALGNDVLSLLLRAHDESGKRLTDAELIGQAAVLFGAAHLTSANTFTWTLFLLAQHPHVAADLVDELKGRLHGDAPTLEQLERLPLLDRVVKESMRVLPASAYSQRVNAEPVELGPFHLLKGTTLIFSQLMTHHMAELFPEPERFMPERWETISPSPYAYLPFAAGPRMCIGAPLAIVTFKVTLSVILQRYCLQVVPNSSINGKVMSTMLTPTTGMPMLIAPANGSWENVPVTGNIHKMVRVADLPDSSRRAEAA